MDLRATPGDESHPQEAKRRAEEDARELEAAKAMSRELVRASRPLRAVPVPQVYLVLALMRMCRC